MNVLEVCRVLQNLLKPCMPVFGVDGREKVDATLKEVFCSDILAEGVGYAVDGPAEL